MFVSPRVGRKTVPANAKASHKPSVSAVPRVAVDYAKDEQNDSDDYDEDDMDESDDDCDMEEDLELSDQNDDDIEEW